MDCPYYSISIFRSMHIITDSNRESSLDSTISYAYGDLWTETAYRGSIINDRNFPIIKHLEAVPRFGNPDTVSNTIMSHGDYIITGIPESLSDS